MGECVFFFFFFEQPRWVEIGSYSIRFEVPHATDDGEQGEGRHPSQEDVRISGEFTTLLERELSDMLDFQVRLRVASLTNGSLIQVGPIEGDAGGILNRLLKFSSIVASIGAGALSFTQALSYYPAARKNFPLLVEDIVRVFDRAIDAVGSRKGFKVIDGRITPREMVGLEGDTSETLRWLAENMKPDEGGPTEQS